MTDQNRLRVQQIASDADLIARIPAEFPVLSQTSTSDKLAFLKARELLGSLGPYSYAEIGSFMGGSLAPFIIDAKCQAILSIDDRGRNQPDERGSTHDYTAISHQTMLDNLARHGLATEKIETFDGSVSGYPVGARKYDLLLIDGEHTDWACFRDFVHGEKLLKQNAVVMFHDTMFILKSLQIIQEMLLAQGRRFVFFKPKGAEVSFILLNDFCDAGFAEEFEHEPDMAAYTRRTSRKMLKYQLQNRTRVPKFLINAVVKRG